MKLWKGSKRSRWIYYGLVVSEMMRRMLLLPINVHLNSPAVAETKKRQVRFQVGGKNGALNRRKRAQARNVARDLIFAESGASMKENVIDCWMASLHGKAI